MSNHLLPPKLPLRFLRFYCKESLHESIEGDLYKPFKENMEKTGLRKAKMKFAWNVIRFFRLGIRKPLSGSDRKNDYGMFRNYFKVGASSIPYAVNNYSINIISKCHGI